MSLRDRFDIDPLSVIIPERELCSRLGFLGERTIPPKFKDKVENAFSRARGTAKPTALVLDVDVNGGSGSLDIGGIKVPGSLASKHLGNCSEASMILLTLGPELDELIYRDPKDTLGSFILDGIGSELAEYSVREVDLILRERRPGMVGGSRISPGYGDLPLSLNSEIVRVLGGGDIGVLIVEGSFEMSPRKTISAFIGWREGQ